MVMEMRVDGGSHQRRNGEKYSDTVYILKAELRGFPARLHADVREREESRMMPRFLA